MFAVGRIVFAVGLGGEIVPLAREYTVAAVRLETHANAADAGKQIDKAELGAARHCASLRPAAAMQQIAQGRFDVVTPISGAWALHRAWPEAKLDVVGDAGHASSEPGIVDSLDKAAASIRDVDFAGIGTEARQALEKMDDLLRVAATMRAFFAQRAGEAQ